MGTETFIERKFSKASVELIIAANEIIKEYEEQGFTLTLRQLYYQFVSRDIIPNTMKSYKNLGSVINDGRLAGRIDWEAIEDRTRNVKKNPHWDSPADLMLSCERQFAYDKWAEQPNYVEVWIEKDALVGVIEGVCKKHDVPYFACRGYTSQSEQWRAGRRFRDAVCDEKRVVILHLGDHDPSGIDMTRDNQERLNMFTREGEVEVKRLALNMDLVDRYNPPPNPTKLTDSRATGYIREFGKSCWELDALSPRLISSLVESNIKMLKDDDLWDAAVAREDEVKKQFTAFRKKLEKSHA